MASILTKIRSAHPAIQWSVLSGLAALIYQVVLQKLFSYVLGYALLSTTIVIAAYMLGLALGGFVAGLFSDRLSRRAALALYSCIEAAIGICGIGSLFAYRHYLSALSHLAENPAFLHLMSLVAFRSGLAIAALLPMTILMGATLPVLILGVNASTASEAESGAASSLPVTSIYSANLLGGLAGVILSSYLVLPWLGLWGATILACGANLTIAVRAWRYRSQAALAPVAPTPAVQPDLTQPSQQEQISWGMVWFLSFASGLVVFALEIVWTHMLSTVIGLSIYSFANMLIAVFIGLYLAALRETRQDGSPRSSLVELVLWGSLALAFSVPFYAWTPFLFSAIGLFSPGFFVRQVSILAVACFLIVPAAMLLSRIFPRLLLVGVPPERKGRGVGFLLAVNTFGCLLGLMVGNFVLVPFLGGQVTLKALAALLGLIAWFLHNRNRKANPASTPSIRFGYALAFLLVVVLAVPWWPPSLLLSNRSTYFALKTEGDFTNLYYMGEDAEGGFVTVSGNPDGLVELRTNGKFQGDNGFQMTAQYSFGYLPALAAHNTGNAFLIGCGTGVSVRAFADAGFQHIDVADLSKSMVFAARNYFRKENGGILDDPRVTVIHDDGRNALVLSHDRYDVIAIEASSIWFAGTANLYSSDFYGMVHRKLQPGGIFMQWVQFHHMRMEDLYVIINTVHKEFKYVALWQSGGQTQVLASDEPITLDWERMRSIDASHPNPTGLKSGDFLRIPFQAFLDSSQVNQFLDHDSFKSIYGHGKGIKSLPPALAQIFLSQYIDSDFFPYLEYSTPRGNALQNQEYLIPVLIAKSVKGSTTISWRNFPQADLPLASMWLASQNGDCTQLRQAAATSSASSKNVDVSALLNGCSPRIAIQVDGLSPALSETASADGSSK